MGHTIASVRSKEGPKCRKCQGLEQEEETEFSNWRGGTGFWSSHFGSELRITYNGDCNPEVVGGTRGLLYRPLAQVENAFNPSSPSRTLAKNYFAFQLLEILLLMVSVHLRQNSLSGHQIASRGSTRKWIRSWKPSRIKVQNCLSENSDKKWYQVDTPIPASLISSVTVGRHFYLSVAFVSIYL